MARQIMRAALLLAPAVAFLRAPARQPTLPRSSTTSEPTTSELADATALSDSFDGAVQDASRGLLKSIGDGNRMLRLDFDTSMGDATYTQLKLSLDFARDVAMVSRLQPGEDLKVPAPGLKDSGRASDRIKRILDIRSRLKFCQNLRKFDKI